MLKLGSNTFAKNNFFLFFALNELHDNMKAWTNLLNNRTRRQNGQNSWTKNAKQTPRTHPRRPRGSQSGREKRWDESFQAWAEEPLGTDSHRTISKNLSRYRLLIGHKKYFVLLCLIGEQFLLCSFREFVHDGYYLDHGLSGSCTKEMHTVRKLPGWYKIPIWFQNTVCPKTKDAFPKIQAWAYNRYSLLHRSRLA